MARNQLSTVYAYLVGKGLVSDKNDFAVKIGMHRTYISSILNDRRPVTGKLAQTLFEKYSINKEWLLHGKGEMISGVMEASVIYADTPAQRKRKATTLREAMQIMGEIAEQLERSGNSDGKRKRKTDDAGKE